MAYIYVFSNYRGKNRETVLSSLQACFVIAHLLVDFKIP